MYPEFVGHPLLKDYPAQRTQPLVEYRTEEEAGLPLEKLPPFREDEGMSWGRVAWKKEGDRVVLAPPLAPDSVKFERGEPSPASEQAINIRLLPDGTPAPKPGAN